MKFGQRIKKEVMACHIDGDRIQLSDNSLNYCMLKNLIKPLMMEPCTAEEREAHERIFIVALVREIHKVLSRVLNVAGRVVSMGAT